MRRLLFAVAVLLTVAASPALAGYIIIRVLLEGATATPATGEAASDTPGATFNHARAVVAVIPLETDLKSEPLNPLKNYNQHNNPAFRKFVVPYYGQKLKAHLFVDSSSIQLYEELIVKPAPRQTRGTQIRDKYHAWQRGKKDPQLLYDALILALESGYINEPAPADGSPALSAVAYAQELLAVATEKKLGLTGEMQKFVTAWGQVKEQMQKAAKVPVVQPTEADVWRSRLDARNVHTSGHYALIYWDSSDSEVNRRSTQLNYNFDAIYLWYATRGTVLPVPTRPLVAVLAPQGQKVHALSYALDGLPLQADAFYAPDHNIVVLSPERLDAVGQTFLGQNHQVFVKGLNRDRLLAGEVPKLDYTGKEGSRPDDVARATTLAVVEKIVKDEAEIAAVTREGTRQLLFTVGVLPAHVTLPNWLTAGAVDFFTRPRGPAYVTGPDGKPFMTVAFSTGYGVPNYVLQRYFRDLHEHGELNPDHARLLENILTDAYFEGLKDGIDPDPAPPAKVPAAAAVVPAPAVTSAEHPSVTLRKKRDRLNIKSQATAWSLYYYLARSRSAELNQYIGELNKLPRDLPIDGRTAYLAFVRVFKLSATDNGPPDPALLKRFAADWLEYMGTVPTVGIDIPLVVPVATKPGSVTEPPPGQP